MDERDNSKTRIDKICSGCEYVEAEFYATYENGERLCFIQRDIPSLMLQLRLVHFLALRNCPQRAHEFLHEVSCSVCEAPIASVSTKLPEPWDALA